MLNKIGLNSVGRIRVVSSFFIGGIKVGLVDFRSIGSVFVGLRWRSEFVAGLGLVLGFGFLIMICGFCVL